MYIIHILISIFLILVRYTKIWSIMIWSSMSDYNLVYMAECYCPAFFGSRSSLFSSTTSNSSSPFTALTRQWGGLPYFCFYNTDSPHLHHSPEIICRKQQGGTYYCIIRCWNNFCPFLPQHIRNLSFFQSIITQSLQHLYVIVWTYWFPKMWRGFDSLKSSIKNSNIPDEW